jgi:hypothetical protein
MKSHPAYNRIYKSYAGSFVIINSASNFIQQWVDRDVAFKPHTLYIQTLAASAPDKQA